MYYKQLATLPKNEDEWLAGCQAIANRHAQFKLERQRQARLNTRKAIKTKVKRGKMSRRERVARQ